MFANKIHRDWAYGIAMMVHCIFSVVYKNDEIKSGKCGDGEEIDASALRGYDGWDTSELWCD